MQFSFSWDYKREDFRLIFSFTQDKNFYENLNLHSHTWCPRYDETDLIQPLLELVERVNHASLFTRKLVRCLTDPEYSIAENGIETRWGDLRFWFPLVNDFIYWFEIFIGFLCEIRSDIPLKDIFDLRNMITKNIIIPSIDCAKIERVELK